ncbi:MAG: hypothetical protein A2787_05065 [Omnitrophica WOR_2 bacterium RIFCSPHIGHO2_01_FULL_48_9]|nr:MAG: hypothetical protein A3D10_01660 [Omnitrophica WOR_2 bacterium RIFCSPHIGHO2_02_FULL_48_11]OGX33985.1 MAG: hypothetical protein A2787_05065 [Omnitrophica WOR_2 bacterium RIFCSPHIGHO2_01_FULL_48_9]
MRKRYLLNIFVLNLIIVWVLASSGLAQQEEAEFTLALRQKEFRVAEPVVVELRVTNKGKKDMQFHRPSLAAQTFRFWIQNKEGLNEQYRSDYIVENIPLLTLAPGETFQTEESIFFNYEKNALAFPQAGEYTLQVEYLGYISGASPPPAEILIKIISNTSSDKEWEEFFKKKETLDFLNQFSMDPALWGRLENLIKKYPKSTFASYGRFYLAHQEAAEYQDKSSNFEKAVELMKTADVKDFQLQSEVLFYLAQWNWQLGRAKEAFDYLDRLVQEFSDTPLAQNAAVLKENWSTQKPPQPPKKVVPVDGKIKKEIEKTLKKYFDAFSKADREGCLAQLDENFRYNEVLNKEAMAEELKEDFEKLAVQEGQWRVSWESEGWQMLEGVPAVNVNISYFVNNQLLSTSRAHIEFIQSDKSWFLKSFNSQ